MPTIGPITLNLPINVGNVDAQATYQLTGSAFDVASGQPYLEECKLMADDTGIVPPEDGIDDNIANGTLYSAITVFTHQIPMIRAHAKTIARAAFNEDGGLDEIRALVTLTPMPPKSVSRESNQVVGNF